MTDKVSMELKQKKMDIIAILKGDGETVPEPHEVIGYLGEEGKISNSWSNCTKASPSTAASASNDDGKSDDAMTSLLSVADSGYGVSAIKAA